MNKKTINLRTCTIKVVDGSTPTANELEATDIDGSVEITLAGYEPSHITNKGAYVRTNEGAFQPGTFTFTENFALFNQSTGSTPVSLFEALSGTGKASPWTSVNDQSDYFQVEVQITLPQQIGETQPEIIVLKNAGLDPNITATLENSSKLQLTGFHTSTRDEISDYTT